MRRDPSLHITKSDLIEVLNELSYTGRTTGSSLTDMIFEKAQSKQIRSRYLSLLNLDAKTKKKVIRSLDAEVDIEPKLVEKFNVILTSIRQANHKNPKTVVRVIRKDSRDYILLKEVAKMAYDFATHFQFAPIADGMTEYVNIGIKKMSKYGLNKFKTYNERIFEGFTDQLDILNDDDRQGTLEFYQLWQESMLEYAGLDISIDIEKDYDKLIHILYGRRDADKHKAHYGNWIVAQFEGLSFLSAIPELVQFYGDNAKKRYDRFMNQSDLPTGDGSILDDYKDK